MMADTSTDADKEVFEDDAQHQIRYKTLSWQVREHPHFLAFHSLVTVRLRAHDCGDRE